MAEKEHLYILWTNADPITADKMVFMYGLNAFKLGWWKKVTIIIWGSPAQLAGENDEIKDKIKELLSAGVTVSACKACADQLGVTDALREVGVEVKYWGEPLTEILKSGEKLLTIQSKGVKISSSNDPFSLLIPTKGLIVSTKIRQQPNKGGVFVSRVTELLGPKYPIIQGDLLRR